MIGYTGFFCLLMRGVGEGYKWGTEGKQVGSFMFLTVDNKSTEKGHSPKVPDLIKRKSIKTLYTYIHVYFNWNGK